MRPPTTGSTNVAPVTTTTGWRRSRVADAVRSRLWPIPLALVAVSIGAAVVLPMLDAAVGARLPQTPLRGLFDAGPDAARAVLTTIATALITVTSLTFSLTVVTLQLASSQFSPRLLRTFTRDRVVQVSLGILLATFTYALLSLRVVASDEQAPQLTVTLALALALASVVTLTAFLAYVVRLIRVETMMREVSSETRRTIDRALGDAAHQRERGTPVPIPSAASGHRLPAHRSGFLELVAEDDLLALAAAQDAFLVLDRAPGDHVVEGTPVGTAWYRRRPPSKDDLTALVDGVRRAVHIDYERTAVQDVRFGLRTLVDVVCKAMSPGINDPTTAVHALGHCATLLVAAGRCDTGPRVVRDENDEPRLVLARPSFAELLDLVMSQSTHYGRDDPRVLGRLVELLREVAWCTDPARTAEAVGDQRARVSRAIDSGGFAELDAAALRAALARLDAARAGEWVPLRE